MKFLLLLLSVIPIIAFSDNFDLYNNTRWQEYDGCVHQPATYFTPKHLEFNNGLRAYIKKCSDSTCCRNGCGAVGAELHSINLYGFGIYRITWTAPRTHDMHKAFGTQSFFSMFFEQIPHSVQFFIHFNPEVYGNNVFLSYILNNITIAKTTYTIPNRNPLTDLILFEIHYFPTGLSAFVDLHQVPNFFVPPEKISNMKVAIDIILRGTESYKENEVNMMVSNVQFETYEGFLRKLIGLTTERG